MRDWDPFFGGLEPLAANKRPSKKKEKKKEKPAAGKGSAAKKSVRAAAAAEPDAVSKAEPPAAKPTAAAPRSKSAAEKSGPAHAKAAAKPPAPVETPVAEIAPEPVAPVVVEPAPVVEPPPQPVAEPAPVARPAMPDVMGELARLRAELQEQRNARTTLEQRLREAETRLREAEASVAPPAPPRPPVAEVVPIAPAATAELDVLALQVASRAGDGKKIALQEFETWFMEAELRLPAEAQETPKRIEVPAALFMDGGAEGQATAKLASMRLSMEAAEARAAHNARQVKRLTEELAEARSAQIRAEARIRVLEEKVRHAQARTELLSSLVEQAEEAEAEPAPLPWPVDMPSETPVAEAAPEPVWTPPAAEPAPVQESWTLEELSAAPELEEIEPAAEAPEEIDGIELGASLDEEPIASLRDSAVETLGELASALELWGAEPVSAEAAPQPAVEAPAAAVSEPAASEDLSGMASLEDALSAWGGGVIEAPAPAQTAAPEPPPAQVEPEIAPTSSRELETAPPAPAPDLVSAPEMPEETVTPVAADVAADVEPIEAVSAPVEAPAAKPEPAKPRSMAEALGLWGGLETPESASQPAAKRETVKQPEPPAQPEPAAADKSGRKTGKEAMVEALLRFMGPNS